MRQMHLAPISVARVRYSWTGGTPHLACAPLPSLRRSQTTRAKSSHPKTMARRAESLCRNGVPGHVCGNRSRCVGHIHW